MSQKTLQPQKDVKSSHRRSYLLRLWCTDDPLGSNWQASLETPENGERIGFANLEELFACLFDLTTTDEQSARDEITGEQWEFRKQDIG